MHIPITVTISIAIVASLTSSSTIVLFTPSTRGALMTQSTSTTTPIKHLVVIFQENISFDHYFGTYPNATNTSGEPTFTASPSTPSVNGLSDSLLHSNTNAANPFRLDRSESVTCDMKHDYTSEQKAYNGGLIDKFVEYTGSTSPGCDPKQVMGYFDGNTVTGLWNYAQHFAMNDNFFGTTFGPSTPGHINLISGQTHGAIPINTKLPPLYKYDGVVNGTLIGNIDPKYDDCSRNSRIYNTTLEMKGKNIGDLLNLKNVTWGWFSAGFRLPNNNGTVSVACDNRDNHTSTIGIMNKDYYPDVEPFQYYKSTANPSHLRPISVAMIGRTDEANHQYDLRDFWMAAETGNLPAVSFLKAATFQDGHPKISDPLEEQSFLINTINRLERLPEWNSTAIIITWDDSDGWYDHVMPPIVSQSSDSHNDRLLGLDLCGHVGGATYQDRCGYGPRIPILIISPFTKINFVDHNMTDQTSILRFIEDNWELGEIGDQSFDLKAGSITNMLDLTSNARHAPPIFLDPATGMLR